MSEFRDKLVALGHSKASLAGVTQSLEALIKTQPENIDYARKLLNAAQRGGLPQQIYRDLMQLMEVSTSPKPNTSPGADTTEVAVSRPIESDPAATIVSKSRLSTDPAVDDATFGVSEPKYV